MVEMGRYNTPIFLVTIFIHFQVDGTYKELFYKIVYF